MKEICRETLEQVYLFLDGEGLPEDAREEIQAHLEACAPCYQRYGLEKEVTALLARLRGADVCPESLRSKIQDLLQTS
jgi:mycothiol system anti-sigma-R factor